MSLFRSRPVDSPARKPETWSGQRKAELIAAIHDGLISQQEACARHGLTAEEIALWERTLNSLSVHRK